MNPLLQCKPTILPLFIAGVLACFGLLPKALAVVPSPDGGYPGFNTAEGQKALFSLTTGQGNTAVGWFTLESLTTGNFNTAIGAAALVLNTADENTATGAGALLSNIGGSSNTATGAFALFNNVGLGAPSKPTGIFFGSFNTANGDRALFSNTNGNSNAATGAGALTENTTGSANTAVGISALAQNTTADDNTGVGAVALFDNTTGTQNTAVGSSALHDNTDGPNNTAIGFRALTGNTTGAGNAAIGSYALEDHAEGDFNTAIGFRALGANTTGNSNTAVGTTAGFDITGSGNVCIGQGVSGQGGVSDTTWIRNVYSSVATARQVYVNSDNKMGTLSSSRRYKDDVKPMGTASETLFALKPVTFRYKKEIDRSRVLSFGLIAEEVAHISPDLITRDEEGQPQTVRYDAVNAMLLNEFLKEHREVAELKSTVAEQRKGMEAMAAQLKEQASRIRKVSAQLELSKSAPQTVLND